MFDPAIIADIIQEIIFVVSPNRSITYINPYGAYATGTTVDGKKMIDELFANSAGAYTTFEKQVLIPSFKKMTPSSLQFFMKDDNGKEIYWHVNTYPVYEKKILDGVIMICRDVSAMVLMAEARLASFRVQMNPHFIFNSLNAVLYYIHGNQKEAAESFLSSFSLLIRKIFDHSTKPAIPLSDELNAIKLYLNLQKIRFGQYFYCTITVGSSLDPENILVPPMLIQPYIENAIAGMNFNNKGSKLSVDFAKFGGSFVCTVQDNGMERQKSPESMSHNQIKDMKPRAAISGIGEILTQDMPSAVSIKTVPLINGQNQRYGTQVTILMPLTERF